MMKGKCSLVDAMNEDILAKFQQAYQDLDLFPLIESEDIARFRVDYGEGVLSRLKKEIIASTKDQKLVFAGHRGSGKSTLLKRLSIEMQPRHFVVFFSIADLIEMSDINHVNILYAIAIKLLSAATKQSISISADIQADLIGWTTSKEKQISEEAIKAEIGFGVDKILSMITAKLQQERSFRKQVEETFAKRITDLVGKMNRVAADIQIATKKTVLVIIDDLDKLDLGMVETIYRDNIKSLFSPGFRILFTIPISAVQEPVLRGVLMSEGVGRVQRLPVAKFFPKHEVEKRSTKATPEADTFNTFLEVLKRRIPAELIEPETAKKIVLLSGGVMRELVRITRECCIECMVLLDSETEPAIKINDQVLLAAVRDLRNDFALGVGEKLNQILIYIYQHLEPEDAGSPEFLNLLQGLYVLEYQNDDLWYDVHPIVVDLLRRRGLIE